MTTSQVIQIFTFYDHLFMISFVTDGSMVGQHVLEDEYGSSRKLKNLGDLKEIREKCGEILQTYRDELMLSEGAS